jgi:hypothetical protein
VANAKPATRVPARLERCVRHAGPFDQLLLDERNPGAQLPVVARSLQTVTEDLYSIPIVGTVGAYTAARQVRSAISAMLVPQGDAKDLGKVQEAFAGGAGAFRSSTVAFVTAARADVAG